MDAANITDESMGAKGNIGEGVFGVLLAIWTVVSNSTLIIAIMTTERRRRSPFCLHIVNIAAADMFLGIIVLPILADYLLKQSWELGEQVCQVWVISHTLFCTISIFALLMINCDRFIFLSCTQIFYNTNARYVLCSIMILMPWVTGCVLVLPLWITGTKNVASHENVCLLVLVEDYQVVSVFVSFFVPALFALGMNISILFMFCVMRDRLKNRLPSGYENPRIQIFVIFLISVVFIAMWAPYFTIMLLVSVRDYTPTKELISFALWLGYCHTGVNPVLWLLYPRVRQAYCRILCCCKPRRETVQESVDENKSSMLASIDEERQM